ncbi:MAG: hypothetical protein Q8S26_10370 [Azonexus sp.]|nr:hypothetical protein [Azonexus sp.]
MLRIVGTAIGGGLAGAWLIYGAVSWWIGLAGVAIALVSFPSFSRFSSRHSASWNCLLAKATFDGMPAEEQKLVMDEVSRILTAGATYPHSDPDGSLNSMPESARFGFVALALAHLHIPPVVGDGWNQVSNPYTAMLGADKELEFVRTQLQKKYGIYVSLENKLMRR